ncbi:hypothetical protein COLO4_17390 [Corchorus olitorius]|uniref:Uncharacterized protein n=1 Tax=Corchorus olitorius TaxID=93759 RepID=A0A1R3JCZ6_9ROSI|nr:hypothetical protein COLO4_17390 [Corchorus olitorius]
MEDSITEEVAIQLDEKLGSLSLRSEETDNPISDVVAIQLDEKLGSPSLGSEEMENPISDGVAIQLDEKLGSFCLRSEESFIFRVPHQLRRINEKAYEPHIISIGPYHRGKQHLRGMEIHKLHYLKMFLQQRNENVGKYVDAMRAMEADARACYDQAVDDDVSPEAFVEMMLLDGCFIVQLIVRSMTDEFGENYCDDFVKANQSSLMHDLLLLENQLPFFVLLKLFDMMNCKNMLPNNCQEAYFVPMLLINFASIMPGPGLLWHKPSGGQNVKHLLGLVHDHLLPSSQGMQRYWPKKGNFEPERWRFIRCASELREAGIKFEKIKVEQKYKKVEVEGDSLFDISFDKGKMMIPTLSIYADTERLFRNLMAYEQFIIGRPTFVADYVTFMDSLINSGKDVEILCRRGIITNWLGDDEVVATMFNRLRDFSSPPRYNFYYAKAFDDINKHCKQRRNIWKAKLRHDYCNTPWAMISFVAASALLLLALAQTIFSILAYSKGK